MSETQTCECDRCGRKCRTASSTNPNATLIRKSLVPKGCCVDCAITCFCKTGPLAEVLGGAWSAPGFDVGAALSLPHVQQQFEAVFRASGCAEASAEISWERVIENWDLPLPATGWDWGGDLYMYAGKKKGRRK